MSFFYENRLDRQDCFIFNENFPLHLHPQIEFMVVLSGHLSLNINGHTYELPAGHAALLYPYQLHSFETEENTSVLFSVTDLNYLKDCHQYFSHTVLECPCFPLSSLSSYGHTAVDMLKEQATSGLLEPLRNQGILYILLHDIFQTVKFRQINEPLDLTVAQKALLYIDKNYLHPLSEGEVAYAVGVSSYHLSHIFSQVLAIHFPEYVTSMRLQYATQLLRSTQLSITEIALESGFSNLRNFHRHFQKKFHESPKSYRDRFFYLK